jgi:hypothetical protein
MADPFGGDASGSALVQEEVKKGVRLVVARMRKEAALKSAHDWTAFLARQDPDVVGLLRVLLHA